MTMTALPLEAVVLAKVAAHWVLTGLPLILAAPVIGLMLNLPDAGYLTLIGVMALVTPTLSLIGAIGASLTLGARRAGVLVSILVLPLYIPALIFATAAIDAAIMDLPVQPYFLILGAMLTARLTARPLGQRRGIAPGPCTDGQAVPAKRAAGRSSIGQCNRLDITPSPTDTHQVIS